MVKPKLVNEAKEMFKNTEVQVSTNGQRHLGAAIGTQEFIEAYATQKTEVSKSLTTIARTQPHATYAAFTHGIIGRRLYLMRTIDVNDSTPEDAIHHQVIPGLTGQAFSSPGVRKLLSLPTLMQDFLKGGSVAT